jgi:hypothetical protein
MIWPKQLTRSGPLTYGSGLIFDPKVTTSGLKEQDLIRNNP